MSIMDDIDLRMDFRRELAKIGVVFNPTRNQYQLETKKKNIKEYLSSDSIMKPKVSPRRNARNTMISYLVVSMMTLMTTATYGVGILLKGGI